MNHKFPKSGVLCNHFMQLFLCKKIHCSSMMRHILEEEKTQLSNKVFEFYYTNSTFSLLLYDKAFRSL